MIEKDEDEIDVKSFSKLVKEKGVFQTLDKIKEPIRYRCPIDAVNIALSGDPRGGIQEGSILTLGGDSGVYKSNLAILLCLTFLKNTENSAILILDSEGGSPKNFFQSYGIDGDSDDEEERKLAKRIIHRRFKTIEELTKIVFQFGEKLKSDEQWASKKFMIVVDSLSFSGSEKAQEDLMAGETKADLQTAKRTNEFIKNSLNPLNERGIPMILICHTYNMMDYAKTIQIKGGKGIVYGSNDILIMSRLNSKTEDNATDFKLKVYKSRTVKRNASINITMTNDNELLQFSGLFELCQELDIFTKEGHSFVFTKPIEGNTNFAKFKREDVKNNPTFWKYVYNKTDFIEKCKTHFKIGGKKFNFYENWDSDEE